MRFLILLALIAGGRAWGFDYFNGQIDYWKTPKAEPLPQPKPAPPPIKPSESKPPHAAEEKFDWKKFADPKNKEFFKEGDYTPPEPFMELARNPTDENIKQWFAVIDTKNQLMAALNRRLEEYVTKNGSTLKPEEKELIRANQAEVAPPAVDYKRFRFRLYFDSTCSHCKNMMGTMKELQDLGYYVEVKQIDKGRPDFPVPFPVTSATPAELQSKNITSWPVTFAADTTMQVVYRLNGYMQTSEVLNALASK